VLPIVLNGDAEMTAEKALTEEKETQHQTRKQNELQVWYTEFLKG